jgi:threonine dehydrogenase-like Zn-dependent dehydrogenase
MLRLTCKSSAAVLVSSAVWLARVSEGEAVGLCAITAATELFGKVYAFDFVEERRKWARSSSWIIAYCATRIAERHGAIGVDQGSMKDVLAKATDGRGPDAVLEVVGNSPALMTAIEMVRPWGALLVSVALS